MLDAILRQRVLDAIANLNTAVSNRRLYPLESATVRNAIDRLFTVLSSFLDIADSVVLAESEKNLLIDGESLSQKEQEKAHITSFLKLLLNHDIRSITLKKGLNISELTAFVDMIVKKPELVKNEDGWARLCAEAKLEHILLDQKVYVVKDKDHQILTSIDIKDDQIIQYIIGRNRDLELTIDEIRQKARDPRWLGQILQAGTEQIISNEKSVTGSKLMENITMMMRVFDRLTNIEQEKVSQLIGSSIAQMDEDIVSLMLTQQIDDALSSPIFNDIIEQIDAEKLEKVLKKIDPSILSDGSETMGFNREARQKAYQRIMQTEKGNLAWIRLEEREALEKGNREEQIKLLKDEIQPVLKEDDESALNTDSLKELPDAIRRLRILGQKQTAAAVIDRLAERLLSHRPHERAQLAETFTQIIADFDDEERLETIEKCQDKLVKWLRLETSVIPVYENLCNEMRDLAKGFIRSGKFAESMPLLDAFHTIYTGKLDRDDNIRIIIGEKIREIATEDVLKALVHEFKTRSRKRENDAGNNLARLGEAPVPALLDMLREETNSTERVRIMDVIMKIGFPAMMSVLERLTGDDPWYYKRNLVYLMGRIGGENEAARLLPFLKHDNTQLRQEAFNSINRIGGEKRAKILLPAFEDVDDTIKGSIVDVINSQKYKESVSSLLNVLKTRPLRASETRITLEEKICKALGNIGSPEAIQTLKEISKPGLLKVKVYPDRVRTAAGNALKAIQAKNI